MSGLPIVVFPDAEQVISAYLRALLPAGEGFTGVEWPSNVQTRLPVVAVSRGGGAVVQKLVTEDVTLDVDVLAATKKAAQDRAQLVRAYLYAAEGTVQAGARIYGVRDISLVWLPYQPSPETDSIPRYVLVMQLRIRPA